MFSAIAGRISSAVSSLSPSTWDPSTPVPSGTLTSTLTLQAKITSHSNLTFSSSGHWAAGTIQFDSSQGDGVQGASPPAYEETHDPTRITPQPSKAQQLMGQLDDGEAVVHVRVEARYNDQAVYDESEVTLVTNGDRTELLVKTPNLSPSRVASRLSFYVAVTFPSSIQSLASLTTTKGQWRTLGAPSLASLRITTVTISNVNALVYFAHLFAGDATFQLANGTLEGAEFQVDSFIVSSASNSNVTLRNVVALNRIQVIASNGNISGTFKAGRSVELKSANGAISGEVGAGERIELKTVNAAISGSIRLGASKGELISLMTMNGKIEAKLRIEDEEKRDELALGPGDVKLGGSSSVGQGRTIRVETKTGNNTIDVELLQAKEGLAIDWEAKTANGKARLVYQGPFKGSYSLSTSNGKASYQGPGGGEAQRSGSKVSGRVADDRGTGAVSSIQGTTVNSDISLSVEGL